MMMITLWANAHQASHDLASIITAVSPIVVAYLTYRGRKSRRRKHCQKDDRDEDD